MTDLTPALAIVAASRSTRSAAPVVWVVAGMLAAVVASIVGLVFIVAMAQCGCA